MTVDDELLFRFVVKKFIKFLLPYLYRPLITLELRFPKNNNTISINFLLGLIILNN